MAKKKQKSIGRSLLHIFAIIFAVIGLLGNLFSIMHVEYTNMRKHLVVSILLGCFCMTLMMTTWLVITAMIFTYLLSLHLSVITAFILLIIFNLLLMLIFGLAIALMKIDTSFPETRKAIQDIISK